MEIRLLGPVEVSVDGVRLTPSAPKVRRVLALLALRHGRVVPVETIIEELWGDSPPRSAMTTVQTYIYQLRRSMFEDEDEAGRVLVTRRPGYLLDLRPQDVDVWHFERLAEQGRQELDGGQSAAAAATLAAALRLWQGSPLTDVQCGTVLEGRVAALQEAWLVAADLRLDAELAVGEPARVIGDLRELVGKHPFHEKFHAKLVRALSEAGRRSEALEAYQHVRATLRQELGTEPCEELRSAQARALGSDQPPRRLLAVPAPVAAAPPRPAQLPADTGDFTGRQDEVAGILAAVRGAARSGALPVVSVTGGIGVGKSSTVVRAAHLLRRDFPDGQLYAELGASSGAPADAGELLGGFLRALGAAPAQVPPDRAGREQMFRSWTAGKRLLLVLDDAACSSQVTPLLPGDAGCAVLVTNRRPLYGVAGMSQLALPVLPPAEAVQLLGAVAGTDRVAAEPRAAAEIAAACGLLPLAVRCAGERLRLHPRLPLAALAAQLADPALRLAELRSGDLDLAGRLAAHYAQLDEPTRHSFGLLALLSAPAFTARQAAVLLDGDADIESLLLDLADANLILSAQPAPGGAPAYHIPELVRLFALQRPDRSVDGGSPVVVGDFGRADEGAEMLATGA